MLKFNFLKMLIRYRKKINVSCITICLLSCACLETRAEKNAALKETSEAKRIVMHSEDAVAAEVLRLRAELESTKAELGNTRAELGSTRAQLGNTTNILQTVLSQMSALEKKVQSIESSQLNSTHEAVGGVYVRWGRTTCPGDAELIYKGYIAGKHYNEHGSGTNNLCLPYNPTWGNYVDGLQGARGRVYGTEIDAIEPNNILSYAVNNQDIPCAACKSRSASTIMIPARNKCYPGWNLEYAGYIVTAAYNLPHSYDYICLDSLSEFNAHGGSDDNQHVLYFTEAVCGSLPCPLTLMAAKSHALFARSTCNWLNILIKSTSNHLYSFCYQNENIFLKVK